MRTSVPAEPAPQQEHHAAQATPGLLGDGVAGAAVDGVG